MSSKIVTVVLFISATGGLCSLADAQVRRSSSRGGGYGNNFRSKTAAARMLERIAESTSFRLRFERKLFNRHQSRSAGNARQSMTLGDSGVGAENDQVKALTHHLPSHSPLLRASVNAGSVNDILLANPMAGLALPSAAQPSLKTTAPSNESAGALRRLAELKTILVQTFKAEKRAELKRKELVAQFQAEAAALAVGKTGWSSPVVGNSSKAGLLEAAAEAKRGSSALSNAADATSGAQAKVGWSSPTGPRTNLPAVNPGKMPKNLRQGADVSHNPSQSVH